MFIAHVYFTVSEDKAKIALDVLLAEVAVVRAMPGCLTFLPFRDPTKVGGLGLLHEWETKEAVAVYAASAGFAAVGQNLRTLMTGTPISKRFDATALETVN